MNTLNDDNDKDMSFNTIYYCVAQYKEIIKKNLLKITYIKKVQYNNVTTKLYSLKLLTRKIATE